MITGGKGGANTKTGLLFEERKSLKSVLLSIEGFSVKDDDLFFQGNKVATFFKKNKLYKNLLEPKGVHVREILSKKLLPDDTLLVYSQNTLFVIELKYQNTPGSVDEKLQTCDFKNLQYHKLLKPLNIKVKYVYVLNDWFKKKEYTDVLKYIKSKDCYYFFEELPLNFLGLPNNV